MAGENGEINHFVAGQTQRAQVRGKFDARNVGQVQAVEIESRQRRHLRGPDRFAGKRHTAIRERHRNIERSCKSHSQRLFMNV